MALRKIITGWLCLLCVVPNLSGGMDLPAPHPPTTLFVYPANHGFLHDTGRHVPFGWAAFYHVDHPGYIIRGRSQGGEGLPEGTYRFVFHFRLLPGHLGGLFRKADDVVRVEAWDRTAGECLVSRTFQLGDLSVRGVYGVDKILPFSAWKRSGHHFEPRVYWPGITSVLLRHIKLEQIEDVSEAALGEKAQSFETSMGTLYLDRGYVIARTRSGKVQNIGDAAIWTGLYAASQAWRYRATRSSEALARMESSLRALHQLHAYSHQPGTLARYIDSKEQPHPDAASKDTYTGFFFAVANCLPFVKDASLRQALLDDVTALGNHFLDHDLAFAPASGSMVNLNPYFSQKALDEAIQDLERDAGARRRFLRTLNLIHFYFMSHGQRPWPELPRLIRALRRNDRAELQANIIPAVNGALRALRQLQRNVNRSARASPVPGEGPYGKFNGLLRQMLRQIAPPDNRVGQLEDVKVLSSSSLHALHFLKVAAEMLPKPNRFEAYYADNLWQHKALIKTALEWDNMDEDVLAALMGRARANALGSASAHLTFLALYDLIRFEKDPVLRQDYQKLFERQYQPHQADYNAFLFLLNRTVGLSPDQTGLGLWSLTLYPADRQGRGERYWRMHRRKLAKRYGGVVMGQARDPLPLSDRPRDCFVWQRSAYSLRGDDDQWLYPPLDYLFVYWMARSEGAID